MAPRITRTAPIETLVAVLVFSKKTTIIAPRKVIMLCREDVSNLGSDDIVL